MKSKTLILILAILFSTSTTTWAAGITTSMITNGDFSLGNTGFSSDYASQVAGTGSMWDPGTYTIDGSAAGNHGLWETGGDHTGGGGSFMLVNGSTGVGKTVWSQTVSTIMGWTYEFSLWAKNLCCTDGGVMTGPELSFWANGLELSPCGTDGAGIWQACENSFLATSRTTTLEVRNGQTNYRANDFGIDDIYVGHETDLTPTPEPVTLVTLGSGLTLLGLATRKRRVRKAVRV